jgi:hypothetical protein
VPHIPTAYYSNPFTHFEWGLMSYPVWHKNQKYTIVTYYVKPL